jgi:hypothetical protein
MWDGLCDVKLQCQNYEKTDMYSTRNCRPWSKKVNLDVTVIHGFATETAEQSTSPFLFR